MDNLTFRKQVKHTRRRDQSPLLPMYRAMSIVAWYALKRPDLQEKPLILSCAMVLYT